MQKHLAIFSKLQSIEMLYYDWMYILTSDNVAVSKSDASLMDHN